MALYKKDLEENLAYSLQKYNNIGYNYIPPFFQKVSEHQSNILTINCSELGRITIGQPGIRLVQIEMFLLPIFKKFDLPFNESGITFQDNLTWRKDLGNLKADTTEQYSESLIVLEEYLELRAFDFWNRYDSYEEIMGLISRSSEADLNQKIFQGIEGIMRRLVVSFFAKHEEYTVKIIDQYTPILNEYALKNGGSAVKKKEAFEYLVSKIQSGTPYEA